MSHHGIGQWAIGIILIFLVTSELGFPGGSDSEESACNAGYLGSKPRSGKSHSSIPAWRIPRTEEAGGL